MRGNVRWGKVLGSFVGSVGNCLSPMLHLDEIVIQMKLNEKRLTVEKVFLWFSPRPRRNLTASVLANPS